MQSTEVSKIVQGNVLDVLRGLAMKRFKTIITSSPYYKMRFYGTELQVWDADQNCSHQWEYKTGRQHAGRGGGQKSAKYSEQDDYPDIPVKSGKCQTCNAWLGELGQEGTRDNFLEHLWQITDQLMRVLDDDGTLWFNIGDKRDQDGSLYNVPHAFVEGMIKRGWIFLDDIVWFKRSVLPQSDPTVFSPDYEPMLHFAKREAPTFYANGTLEIMQREEPLGTAGEEGRDWHWSERMREPRNKNKKCENGIWYEKRSLWQPYSYFHETQYEQYSEASLKQIEQVYNGQSKKHKDSQLSLDGLMSDGVQNPSDVKRRVIESIRRNMPLYGGNKAEGYGNGTYSGKPWQPEMGGGGSNIRCDRGYSNDKGELVGNDPAFGRYMRTVWDIIPARFAEAHFATFPIELVERCLKASCPEQVCTKCGLGWRKMYSEERRATRPGIDTGNGKSGSEEDPNSALHNSELSRKREAIIRREAGIMKCTCNAPTRPGTVLDPFMGSGTTALAAKGLARDWLGIELNPSFIEMAEKRLLTEFPDQQL